MNRFIGYHKNPITPRRTTPINASTVPIADKPAPGPIYARAYSGIPMSKKKSKVDALEFFNCYYLN